VRCRVPLATHFVRGSNASGWFLKKTGLDKSRHHAVPLGNVVVVRNDANGFAGPTQLTTATSMPTEQSTLAMKIGEACSASRCGRTTIYDAIRQGQLRAVKRGKSTLILESDLRRWLESLPAIDPKRTAV
jgi:excisionase family DNA binding protein